MRAIICFGPSKNRWLRKFLSRDFQHCFVILYTGGKALVVDPAPNFVIYRIYDEDKVHAYGREICHAVSVEVKENDTSMFGIHTCVSHIKRIIGLDKRWILTPRQLYNEVKKWDCQSI